MYRNVFTCPTLTIVFGIFIVFKATLFIFDELIWFGFFFTTLYYLLLDHNYVELFDEFVIVVVLVEVYSPIIKSIREIYMHTQQQKNLQWWQWNNQLVLQKLQKFIWILNRCPELSFVSQFLVHKKTSFTTMQMEMCAIFTLEKPKKKNCRSENN